MKITYTLLLGAFLGTLALSAQAGEKWTVLFDGKKVSGLRGYGQKTMTESWAVKDGTLKTVPGAKNKRDLITTASFTDFEFECEWKVSPGGNSGIMYRVKETNRPAYFTGPEMQVLDDEKHPDGHRNFPKRTAGSLYDMYGKGMKNKEYNKAGQWNKARIVIKDNVVQHYLNGTKIIEYKWGSDEVKAMIANSKFKTWQDFMGEPKGHIVLQHHGEEVWYRNIRVRGK